jgi:hypothetical protein
MAERIDIVRLEIDELKTTSSPKKFIIELVVDDDENKSNGFVQF